MQGSIGRGDNIMREMAREVNLLEQDRNNSAQEEISQKQRMRGQIIFGVIALALVVIVALFVVL